MPNRHLPWTAAGFACVMLAHPLSGQSLAEFREIASVDVGRNPHQISFSADGGTAWIATAGEERITTVDVATFEVGPTIPMPSPLGVIPLPNGTQLAVAWFRRGGVKLFPVEGGFQIAGGCDTSPGASLIVGPYLGNRYLVSVEQANAVLVFEANTATCRDWYGVGSRPFPPAATSDFRKAFVPGYADGTVTVIDLAEKRVLASIPVGENPSGGVVLPGDDTYAVVVRGEDRIVFIDTETHDITGGLREGIGDSPFSFVVAPNGRLGFVNNTASHDVSVVALPERRVIGTIGVPDVPIVMAVHPSGETLWVSSEGIHRLTVLEIPAAFRR